NAASTKPAHSYTCEVCHSSTNGGVPLIHPLTPTTPHFLKYCPRHFAPVCFYSCSCYFPPASRLAMLSTTAVWTILGLFLCSASPLVTAASNSDAQLLFQRLANVSLGSQLSLLQPDAVNGDLSIREDYVRFPAKSSLLTSLRVSSLHVCPWHLGSCDSDRLRLSCSLRLNNQSGAAHLFTVVMDSHGEPYLLSASVNNGKLLVQLKQGSETKAVQVPVHKNRWLRVDLSLVLSTRNVQVSINDQTVTQSTVAPMPLPSILQKLLADQFVGILYGSAASRSSFDLRSFDMITEQPAPRIRFTRPQYNDNLYRNPAVNDRRTVGSIMNSLDYQNGGYVRYDFLNRIRMTADNEEVSLRFVLPQGNTEGILWYARGQDGRSYSLIYVKVSDTELRFIYSNAHLKLERRNE
ncbi:Neurexin-3-beta, partial [Cichlidogyrus casuarinus]